MLKKLQLILMLALSSLMFTGSAQAAIWDAVVMDPVLADILLTLGIVGAFVLTATITIRGYSWAKSALNK